MTDFYSVLKTSIIQRDLRSAAARHDVYDQAREAMIRRLWSLDPPLSEDEIDARIGSFDAAVEKIEDDLERSFSTAKAGRQPSQPRSVRRAPPERPAHPPPVYEADDYATAVGHPSAQYRSDVPQLPYRNRGDSTARGGRQQDPRRQISHGGGHRDRPVAAATGHERTDDRRHVAQSYDTGMLDAGPSSYAAEPAYGQAARPLYDYDDSAYDETAYHEDDFARGQFDNNNRNQLPAAVEAAGTEAAYGDIAYRSDGFPDTGDENANYDEPPYEEAAYYEYDDQEYDRQRSAVMPARGGGNAYDARRPPDQFRAEEAYHGDFEPATRRYRAGERRSAKRARAKGGKASRKTRGRSVPLLAIVIGALALILIAFNAYIFLPILFGSAPLRSASTASPTKIEDRLPSSGSPGAASTRIASSSATAVEIPERNLNVTESLVIFNGSDPTVFEGTSNNPIVFDSDSEGGFARISSAASAAGARAIIGPGLADRLAGRTVRVTLLARSSTENGAATMRFAYQSGLAVSHWQSADLSPNYGTYGIIWRVPAADTQAGDYLLIEPGIPGDGTSTDIRMIKIDILAS
jgi:hypothetical protein